MSIGKEVKEIMKFKKELLRKIYDTFNSTLIEIGEEGLQVRDKTIYGENLKAMIGGDYIEIPITVVLNELREPSSNKIERNISDDAIKNTIDELIIKELTL